MMRVADTPFVTATWHCAVTETRVRNPGPGTRIVSEEKVLVPEDARGHWIG